MSCSSELRQRRRSWRDTPGSPHPEFSVLLDPSISCAVLCCRSVATSQGAFSVLPTMAQNMDRGLDEIIAEKRTSGPRNRRGGRDNRRRGRNHYPRDGVRKSTRDDRRNIDSEWVHDRYDESESRRGPASRRRRDSPVSDNKGSKIRVENIHYDLTEEDLDELFARIGRVSRLNLRYDRAGRSEGVAYVTYEQREDAEEAIKQFDGANANGQPIRLTLLPSRNPFDTAVMPGRPLAERISAPGAGGRARSTSPRRRLEEEDAARKGIDRYIPGRRSRSPMPRRQGGRGGRRPGARREGGNKNNEGGRGGRGNPRGKKTQEELDAEMADYFGGGGNESAAANAPANGAAPATEAVPAAGNDDIDMIE
ncbi:RNA binding protein, putative [Metarhizium acridum CQMa 102]|uniref:RNA binding protein, putative n=1 Tax=Metarhizium acridum (strain CQMa 102) TaxID=655827 RepID=E9DTP6_METAQ|nr:RNA binding protein, putative [Metarhizium acridum CQMa 102]EFY92756.1 RNA binding protein, putative [Metarhizium acridum CQMa 102]